MKSVGIFGRSPRSQVSTRSQTLCIYLYQVCSTLGEVYLWLFGPLIQRRLYHHQSTVMVAVHPAVKRLAWADINHVTSCSADPASVRAHGSAETLHLLLRFRQLSVELGRVLGHQWSWEDAQREPPGGWLQYRLTQTLGVSRSAKLTLGTCQINDPEEVSSLFLTCMF